MKRIIVIIIIKMICFLSQITGKGSSLPGKIALKLYPDILSTLKLPENIIMVTGSNGKTTTAGMINDILIRNGFTVGYNYEGSNQIEGVTTLLLKICNLSGKVERDILVLEVDERYTRHVLKFITPKYYVVTNLYRDQLTRNGHPEHIYSIIAEGVSDDMHLVLNTDDPLSSMMGYGRENVTYFGVDKNSLSMEQNTSIYNDGAYCPQCKAKLSYDYYQYNHIGGYRCDECGHMRQNPEYCVTDIDAEKGTFVINNEHVIQLYFKSYFNVYNLLTAFAATNLLGVDGEAICDALNNYIIKKERVIEFENEGKNGMLLLSKHENSISYNQSINYIVNQGLESTVAIIVDSVSRKYYTSETSWLWDIDFEELNSNNIKKIILAGQYAYDLGVRFDLSGIDESRIVTTPDLDHMMDLLKDATTDYNYVLTCFSDKKKFTDRVKKWK